MSGMHGYGTNEEILAKKRQAAKKALIKNVKIGAGIMVGVISVVGLLASVKNSTVIDQGNFGIEKHWGGSFNSQALGTGFQLNAFDKIYEVYGKQLLIKIENVRPKDKSGIMLKDLDLNVGIRANPGNAIPFLLQTGDIKFDTERKVYILGEDSILKESRSVANQSIRKFESEELIDKQEEVEKTFQSDLQKKLDELYGKNAFTVTEVKLANVQFSDSVEEKIQSIELIRTEESKAMATEKVLAIRNSMLNKEVKGLKEVANDNNISFDQLLDYQKTRVLMEGKVQAQVTMPASTAKP